MIKNFLIRLLQRRHFWRYVGFAELAELYTSRMMRILALNMVTVLIAVYLYQLGFSVTFICGYFAVYFLVRALCTWPAMHAVAWLGPKHGTLWGNLLYIPALLFLWLVPTMPWVALLGALLFKAASTTLYDIAYTVDFSKVKHSEHAGKELGYMQIFERVAMAISPLLGGFVAFIWEPQVTIVVAAVLFAIAASPLFLTPEPLPTRQKIQLKGFRPGRLWRSLVAEGAGAMSNEASNGGFWSLFILICVIGTVGNAAYAEIGALSAISLVASLAISYIFGLLIDRRRGGELLRLSVVGLALTHVVRPFLPNTMSVAVMNMASEVASTGYKMPFLRGMFDQADNLPGFRIVYMATMSAALCVGAALANASIALLVALYGEVAGLKLSFAVIAAATLLIATHNFALYRRS